MIVTEATLAPYRSHDGSMRIGSMPSDALGMPTKYAESPEEIAALFERLKASSAMTQALSDFDGYTQTDRYLRLRREPSDTPDPRDALEITALLAFTVNVPKLAGHLQWFALQHQCGGYACRQVAMIGTELRLRPASWIALQEIVRTGYFAERGNFCPPASQAQRRWHRRSLSRMGLTCSNNEWLLAEATYPLDATQGNLRHIADDAPDLRSIADWGDCEPGSYPGLAILVLTENSD